ncbi:hypothetical protein [Trichothermofontia sp.]
MKFWIASFVLLFGLAELYQWVQHFTFPLPVFILGGVFLAIASNHDKRVGFPGQRPLSGTASLGMPPVKLAQPVSTVVTPSDMSPASGSRASTSPFEQYAASGRSGVAEQTDRQATSAPSRSISFTIDPTQH